MPPDKSTVTCLPATGLPSEAQLVASSSSINLARLMPSPDAARAAGRAVDPHLHRKVADLAGVHRERGGPGVAVARSLCDQVRPSPVPAAPGRSAGWPGRCRRPVPLGLVVPDEQLGAWDDRVVLVDRPERHGCLVRKRRGEARRRVHVARAVADRTLTETALRERVPQDVLVATKRIMSAASMASRDWTMLTGLNVISGNESNISCAQRRLPGQDVTGVSPFAQDFCSAGVPAPYQAIIADLMSKFVALQVSPEAYTCSPTKS